MSAVPLVEQLRSKVAGLSSSNVPVAKDASWFPSVPFGHTAYTWVGDMTTTSVPSAASIILGSIVAPSTEAPAVVEVPVAAPKSEEKKEKKAAAPVAAETDANVFTKCDFRVGKLTNVRDHPGAESLYITDVLVGDAEPVQVVTNLKKSMTKEELEGKVLVFLCNLKPTAFRGEKSFAMILGGASADGAHGLVVPAEGVAIGTRLAVAGQSPVVGEIGRLNDKVFAQAFSLLSTNAQCELTFNGEIVVAGDKAASMPTVSAAIFGAK